jgi:hypothetical protein
MHNYQYFNYSLVFVGLLVVVVCDVVVCKLLSWADTMQV